MKILLIDADSKIPNLALMKISTYYKSNGHEVKLIKLNLPYYPSRKRKYYHITEEADKIFCSVIFDGNKEYIIGNNIEFGGTGYSVEKTLPNYIEECHPDYSLYPENDTSYGFITRGCIRNCSFCKVPKKEGMIRRVSDIEDIVRHKKVKFMDNNILAYNEHIYVLKELVDKQIKCQFNQGLDIRLITKENSELLSKMNYLGKYLFAFDNWKYKSIIEEKLKLMKWRKPDMFKFFVYVHPKMDIQETVKRVEWLRQNKCLPYIMRDISCWSDSRKDFFTDYAAYCNQPNFFSKLSFEDFLHIRHKNKSRIEKKY